jgi:predicted urease superfamily metal-dependent hydrolase
MTDTEVYDKSCKTQEMYKSTGFTKYRVLQHFKRINYLTYNRIGLCDNSTSML